MLQNAYKKIGGFKGNGFNSPEKMILESINKFKNINIFINRNENIKYEIEGRIQSEKEAKEIDNKLKELLQEFKMEFIDYYN